MKGLQITLLFFFLPLLSLPAQELPRRPFLGIRMEAINAENAAVIGLSTAEGVLLQQVFPNSTAEASGMRQGDVLLRIGDRAVDSPQAVVEALRAYEPGQSFTYRVWREGKTIDGRGELRAWTQERYVDFDLEYGSVRAGEALLRTLVTSPRGAQKKPAVLFIQGIGCYSLDTPLDTARSETQLLNQLTRQGFITMRVDKSGQGDSRGEPCSTISFETELEGYVAALKQLKKRPDVDAGRVFLIGHSMGGVMAPLAARQESVAGIIAYGTIGASFIEYLINSRRTIAQAYGMTPAETDDYIKTNCECAAMFYIQKLSAEEAAQINPECRDLLTALEYRSRAYNDQLYALNIPAAWQAFDGRLLAAWGESDYIANREEHRFIVEAVNSAHPGHATFIPIPDSDHGMNLASDLAAARTNPGPYNREVGKVFIDWLKEVM